MSSTSIKTRTRKSPAQRSAEILEAATQLAREDGLSALTLRSVADRAGVASGLIAHYQPSMDDLVATVYSDLVGVEIREVEILLAEQSEAPARMAVIIGTLLDGTREDLTVVWVEAWALGRRNSALAVAVREQMDAWHDLVSGVIVDGCAT
ncbi:MAG: TetR/AcrR family transcriptional regulator, partial [Microbacterium sp.]